MILRLQKKFVRIALLSVTIVLLLLTLTVNVAYRISVDGDLKEMLELISENRGTIPPDTGKSETRRQVPDKENPEPKNDSAKKKDSLSEHRGRESLFYQETVYATRYFVLHISDKNLESSNLEHIAAVTEADADTYADVALRHGEGFGSCGTYKFYVTKEGSNRYMAVFLDCYQEMRSVRQILLWSVAADLFCVALVYVLVTVFSRKAVEPVSRAMEQQQRFITDASHELKTPLAVISTSLSVLQMEVGAQKWIDKAQAQITRMSGLVSSMITLSRLDENRQNSPMEYFPLSEAVEAAVEPFKAPAQESGHELHTDITPGIMFFGEQESICRLVGILMENALKYASEGGTITVTLRKERQEIVLCQSNPCNEIAQSDLEKLFDRFYRPDQSRNSSTGGYGLGLSIARSIAEMHHGSINAQYRDGNIVFSVILKGTKQ